MSNFFVIGGLYKLKENKRFLKDKKFDSINLLKLEKGSMLLVADIEHKEQRLNVRFFFENKIIWEGYPDDFHFYDHYERIL